MTGTFLVIDDQQLVATSLAYTLRANGFDAHHLPVIDLESVRAALADYEPGVALLDLDLGTGPNGEAMDGVDLIGSLRAQGWRVLVVTGTEDIDQLAAAVAHGADNWIGKNVEFDDLVAAAIDLSNGRGLLAQTDRAELESHYRRSHAERQRAVARMRRLSPRERHVLDQLVQGLTPADIARINSTSPSTVRNQIHAILSKLEVNSQVAAIAVAHQHGARTGEPRRFRHRRGAADS